MLMSSDGCFFSVDESTYPSIDSDPNFWRRRISEVRNTSLSPVPFQVSGDVGRVEGSNG